MQRAEALQQQTVQTYRVLPEGVALLTLNNPPLNALNFATRVKIMQGIERAEQDPAVKAVVITGNGRAFSAGADITEFSMTKMKGPMLPEVLNRIEGCRKLVVAAVNGMALGGGTETALACHARVASKTAVFSLPEIKLGLIPGAGGTQRLPRLCGPEFAIRMCCTGGNIKAPVGLKAGLVDEVVAPTETVKAAVALALKWVAAKKPIRRTKDLTDKLGSSVRNYFVFRAARQQVLKSTPEGMVSPLKALDAVQAACSLPSFAAGMKYEIDTFMQCAKSPQAAAMQHFFFAERQAAKVPGLEAVKPLPVRTVGVIGGGTMGGGIAMCFLNIGIPVTLLETTPERKQFAESNIRASYEVTVKRGRMTPEALQKRMSLLTVVADDWAAFQDADYIIEAVFENMALKKQIFTKLDAVCKSSCVLATNTSTLSVDEIASATKRPESVIGAHFFSPANVMKLLEFIRGPRTGAVAIATSMAVGKMIKKAPVIVGNCFGFVANRMMLKGGFSVNSMVEEGAMPTQIDAVMRKFGFPIGPVEMQDLAGLDVSVKIGQEMPAELKPKRDVTTNVNELVKRGRCGQKTMKGWYMYAKENPRKALPDPEVDKLIIATSQAKKFKRRHFDAREIQERYLYIMINEGAKILEEKYATRPSDIDIIFIYGFGFPPYRGGPMHYADLVGVKNVVTAMERINKALGGDSFPEPCNLLKQMAASGATFGAMNKK